MNADTLFWPLAALAMVATGHVFVLWRVVEERTFRSRMYALRDELRWAAIKDPRLAASPIFDHFDRRLTCSAMEARVLSPYLALPFLWHRGMIRTILRASEQATRTVQSSGIDSVQGLSARIDAALYTFLWRRSPLAMLALAVGLRLLTEGRRSLRAVAAACTIAAIDIRLDGAVHTQTAA